MTLQLSNKGLKIIQNVTGKRIHENYRVGTLIILAAITDIHHHNHYCLPSEHFS